LMVNVAIQYIAYMEPMGNPMVDHLNPFGVWFDPITAM
jgi:hypothetical protein